MKASEHAHKELARMYSELTDPDKILDNKKRHEKIERIAERKSDTGYEEY